MDNRITRITHCHRRRSGLTRRIVMGMITAGSLVSLNPANAQTAADLLSDVIGTYNLTFTESDATLNNTSLVTGDKVSFVIASGARLCTPDLNLTGGVLSPAPINSVLWSNAFADVQINVRLVDTNADLDFEFQEIDYRNSAGFTIGRFSLAAAGDFTAGTGTCGASSDPTSAQIDAFFSSAETAFSAQFPSGPFTFTQTFAGSSFRYYDSTGITLAVSAGQVYAKGGGYGTEYVNVGRFSDLAAVGGINNIIRPATVPSFFTGTYLTAMSDTAPFSPIPAGTSVRYVITSSGQLCLANRAEIFNPFFINNTTNAYVWFDSVQRRSYRVQEIDYLLDEELNQRDAALGLLQVFSQSGLRYGELRGERTSLDAFCSDLNPQHPDTLRAPRIEHLFSIKEQLFPENYPVSPIVQTQRTSEYTFRYYPETNRFIAVRSGIVYEGFGTVSFTGAASGELEQVISTTTAATTAYTPASFMVGTYDMVVSGASPLSSAPNGTRIRMVLASNGTLCVDNVSLTSPTVPRSALSDVSWTNMQMGLNAFMVAPSSLGPVTVHLTSSQGDSFGTLDGSRVSTRATCPGTAPTAAEITAADEFFILAQRKFPDLLPASGAKADRTAGNAITRLYIDTDVTLSIVAGEVFARGGSFGSNDVLLGNLSTLLPELRTEVGQATKPAVIPSTLVGTYDMVIAGATPISPFASSTRVRLVIASNGDLCINNLISSNPQSEYTNTQLATWTHSSTDMIATLDLTDTSNGLTIALRNSVATSLGTLTGTRVSSNTFCSTTPISGSALQSIDEFFLLAERRYPDVLPGGDVTQLITGPALSRTYSLNNVVMTIVNEQVFVRGGNFASTDTLFGNLFSLLSELRATVGGDTRAAVIPSRLSGSYEMLVSGASPLAPFANNSRVRVVFRPNGELCINNQISSNPRSAYTTPQQVRWTYTNSGFVTDLDTSSLDADTTAAIRLSVSNGSGTSFGTLAGVRISAETDCSSTPITSSDLSNINEFFVLAERKYADLFPAGNSTTLTTGPAVRKLYENNGLALTVFYNKVFVRGGEFGELDVFFGNLDTLLQNLRTDVGAPNRPAVIPAALVGTYDMLVSGANPVAPFANNSHARVVLGADGSLCINNVITTDPRSEYTSPQLARWTNTSASLIADLNIVDTSNGVLLSLRNTTGASQGTLTGTRISADNYCSTQSPSASEIQTINELFLLAERQYPDLLPAGVNVTHISGPAVSRRYTANGLILSVVNNQVFARGAEFGSHDVAIGDINTQLAALRPLVGGDNKPATLPVSFIGTYDMLVSGANPLAPFATNSRVRVVIRPDGDLCLNSLISSNPRSEYSTSHIANWTFTTANLFADIDTSDIIDGVNISLRNTTGGSLGSLAGPRVSADTFCSSLTLGTADIQTINELFTLAERQYPDQLVTGTSSTQTTGPAVRRSYADSGLVLTVVNGRVLARGGEFGLTDVEVGALDTILSELRTLVGGADRAAVIPASLTGTYELLVSGANPFAPFANNSILRAVVSSNGDLCLNNILSTNPRSDYGSLHIATWTNTAAGLVTRLNMTDANNGLVMQLSNTAGNSLGTLTGARVSSNTWCSTSALSAATVQSINSLFELAERRSPDLFPSQASNTTLTAGGAVWKRYPGADAASTVVLGVANNEVFARGGSFGTTDFSLGSLQSVSSQWLAEVGPPPAQTAQYSIRVIGTTKVTVGTLGVVNGQLNFNRQVTYSLSDLVDNNLGAIARSLLSGEITDPDSTDISDITRANGVVSFRAVLRKTTLVNSREITAVITLTP